jgi:hypothetical protein
MHCSDLAQQPSRLPDFISFRLAVRAIRQQQEDLLVSLPAQVAELYASVTAWGFRLPHTDQVGVLGTRGEGVHRHQHSRIALLHMLSEQLR